MAAQPPDKQIRLRALAVLVDLAEDKSADAPIRLQAASLLLTSVREPFGAMAASRYWYPQSALQAQYTAAEKAAGKGSANERPS
jgi:hypothetical protein